MKLLLILVIHITSFAGIFFISEAEFNSRSSGLRNSGFASGSYAADVISNPSFLSEQKEAYLASTYRNNYKDISSGSLTLSHPSFFLNGFPAAVTLSSISYGKFEDIENGTDYTPYELMLILSTGCKYREIMAGVNLKYIYSSLSNDFDSSGLAMDISAVRRFYNEKLSLALGVANIGFQVDPYNGYRESIDTFLKSGIGYSLEKLPVVLMFQSDMYFNDMIRNAAGLEFRAKENLTVRAGYEFSGNDMIIGTDSKSEQFSGVSLGASVLIGGFGFDLSYSVNGGLENEFGMTMNLNLKEYLK